MCKHSTITNMSVHNCCHSDNYNWMPEWLNPWRICGISLVPRLSQYYVNAANTVWRPGNEALVECESILPLVGLQLQGLDGEMEDIVSWNCNDSRAKTTLSAKHVLEL